MVFPVALAIASFAISVDPGESNVVAARSKEPVTIRIGHTKVSGKRVQLESGGANGREYRCALIGEARLSMFKDDVQITAEKIHLEASGNEPKCVVCFGGCHYRHADGTIISGDKLTLDDKGLQVFGNATLHSKDKTLTAETITWRNGKVEVNNGNQ